MRRFRAAAWIGVLLVAIFVLGYLAIVLEGTLHLNKAAAALLTGVACWTAFIALGDPRLVNERLAERLADVSQIVFFLLTAMTIVEVIDAHDGFALLTSRVRTRNRRKVLLTLVVLTFCLSAVLDNLTTAIVMMALVRRIAPDAEDRMYLGGIVVMAANAGGVFSPIGDVTTTMLWVGEQITTRGVVVRLVLPAIVSVAVPTLWLALRMRGELRSPAGSEAPSATPPTARAERIVVLLTGMGVLLFVPVFKAVTHLPPVMGSLLGLGLLWTLTELIHKTKAEELRGSLTVTGALHRIDAQSVLFFLGILLAVGALESDGKLAALATWMDRTIGNVDVITLLIGLSSSIVDNVPLVAAAQGMYSRAVFPTDHHFWLFLAYCAGTGGSILIIGSAAGVAVMGMERIGFGWYLRKLSLPALLGYAAGAVTYLVVAVFL